ncbi:MULTISPECIES: hypothetical protein [Streptomyces]|uniref:Uncharacterized protein n=1 Tax=Streptomyces chartreusis NRRL 3882 TaxID=1079985 RepID=A0A2N9BEP8_STRCX|nr:MULTISPECIES: hypothetical protein [Streptomyces]MYS95246.1 hypothetical protein [Streptomyces sp. SID5464]SOR81845.1 hypothetical protein SCNRRL3882_5297 [Streptomyces chartreusis NRRL 3882]
MNHTQPRAFAEGGIWYARLEEAEALAEFLADPEPGGRGRPLPGSLTDAPNAAAVEALAAGDPALGRSASE